MGELDGPRVTLGLVFFQILSIYKMDLGKSHIYRERSGNLIYIERKVRHIVESRKEGSRVRTILDPSGGIA